MRTIIFTLLCVMSVSSYADSNCKTLSDDANALISWSGTCENGLANGIGELVYRPKKPIKTFGMVKKGNITGLHLAEEQGFGYVHLVYFNEQNGNAELIGPFYESKGALAPQIQKWADFNGKLDSQKNKPLMTYEEVLNRLKTFVAQKNEASVDFEIFKAYLEGRVRVTGEDDPPVLGAALKPSAGKPKQKK